MSAKEKRGGHPMFYQLGEEENSLYSAKHYQYATDDDPMSNFRRCGQLIQKMLKPGVDPTIAAALALMSKQVVGVYEIVGEGKTNTVESLEDKLKDIGIYSRIVRILVKESSELRKEWRFKCLCGEGEDVDESLHQPLCKIYNQRGAQDYPRKDPETPREFHAPPTKATKGPFCGECAGPAVFLHDNGSHWCERCFSAKKLSLLQAKVV